MCCGGKCLFFINHRVGSLIFGYISAILSAAGTLACTLAALFIEIRLMFISGNAYSDERYGTSELVALSVIAVYLIEFLSGFVCSVLLLVGITKNKPALIKNYVMYGMVQIMLLLIYFIMVHCMTNFFYSGYLLLAKAILGLYALCLYMLFLTYQQMNVQNGFVNPQVEALVGV